MKYLFIILMLEIPIFSFSQSDETPAKSEPDISSLWNQHDKDAQAIRKVLQAQTDSWNRGNIDEFMHGYWENDSLKFIGKGGVTYGYKQTLANYKKNYNDT